MTIEQANNLKKYDILKYHSTNELYLVININYAWDQTMRFDVIQITNFEGINQPFDRIYRSQRFRYYEKVNY